MSTASLVGIVGGYGAVGMATARLLRAWGAGRLRIGGRRPELAAAFVARDLAGDAEIRPVDVYDPTSLADFCAGCDVVVNCAGPSYRVRDRVAVAAGAARANYVDPGGDQPVRDALAARDLAGQGLTALVNAGLMPGLTALLPLGLARTEFQAVTRIAGFAGVVDRMTPAGAAEYLLSLGGQHGQALAGWRNGQPVARALEPLTGAELPFFPGRVDARPFLSVENAWLARAAGADELDWYNVFDGGGHVLAALGRLSGAIADESNLDAAAEELARAAELDLFGREAYQLIVVELSGQTAGGAGQRTIVLRGSDTYELTGLLSAQATMDIITGQVPVGGYFAAEVVGYEPVCARLREHPAVQLLDTFDGAATGGDYDEGTL